MRPNESAHRKTEPIKTSENMKRIQFIMRECTSALYNVMSGLDWEVLKKSPVFVFAITTAFIWLFYHISRKNRRHAPDGIYDIRLNRRDGPTDPPMVVHLKPLLHYAPQSKFMTGHALMKVVKGGKQIGSRRVCCTIDHPNGSGSIRRDYDADDPAPDPDEEPPSEFLKSFDSDGITLSGLQFNASTSAWDGLWKCGNYLYGTFNIFIEIDG